MTERALITAVGEDKPGLVAAVSGFISRCGCNIEDSRMAALGGEFAMLVLVAGEPPKLEALVQGVGPAGREVGLMVNVRRTQARRAAGVVPYALTAYSMDHPGIVQRVTEYLSDRKINIRSLETRLTEAPHTGDPLFSLHATIDVPSAEKVGELRKGLAEIGSSENIDLELKPAG
jgi:glycine cleavage system transcriptional repressor